MEKPNFKLNALVANTYRTSADTLPRWSAQTTWFKPTGDELWTKTKESGNFSEECSTVKQPNRVRRQVGAIANNQCSSDTGADTWKKQALEHMPVAQRHKTDVTAIELELQNSRRPDSKKKISMQTFWEFIIGE